MRDIFIETLSDLVEKHPEIILITGDLGFGVFNDFIKKYPNNFFNAGVAEQNMTGLAAGMAMEGRVIFTYSIGNFPTLRCLEQIRNDLCYHDLNVNIVSIGGGFSYGSLGISHHATEDLAILRSLPNITVVSPTGLWETKQATKALFDSKGTGFLRLDKSKGDDKPSHKNDKFKLGKSRKLRDGIDCTIIVTGGILEEAQLAASELSKNNIDAGIISMHTIKPFDNNAILDAYNSTNAIITLEEHTTFGGLGSAVAEYLADNQLTGKKFMRIGLDDGFSSIVGDQSYLRKCYKMDYKSIYKRISKLIHNP